MGAEADLTIARVAFGADQLDVGTCAFIVTVPVALLPLHGAEVVVNGVVQWWNLCSLSDTVNYHLRSGIGVVAALGWVMPDRGRREGLVVVTQEQAARWVATQRSGAAWHRDLEYAWGGCVDYCSPDDRPWARSEWTRITPGTWVVTSYVDSWGAWCWTPPSSVKLESEIEIAEFWT